MSENSTVQLNLPGQTVLMDSWKKHFQILFPSTHSGLYQAYIVVEKLSILGFLGKQRDSYTSLKGQADNAPLPKHFRDEL